MTEEPERQDKGQTDHLLPI